MQPPLITAAISQQEHMLEKKNYLFSLSCAPVLSQWVIIYDSWATLLQKTSSLMCWVQSRHTYSWGLCEPCSGVRLEDHFASTVKLVMKCDNTIIRRVCTAKITYNVQCTPARSLTIHVVHACIYPSPEDMREACRLVEGGAVHDTKMR